MRYVANDSTPSLVLNFRKNKHQTTIEIYIFFANQWWAKAFDALWMEAQFLMDSTWFSLLARTLSEPEIQAQTLRKYRNCAERRSILRLRYIGIEQVCLFSFGVPSSGPTL